MFGLLSRKAVPLGQRFQKHISKPTECHALSADVLDEMLPLEKSQLPASALGGHGFDAELVQQFAIIDLVAVLSLRFRRRVSKLVMPRFAVYDVKGDGRTAFTFRAYLTRRNTAPDCWPARSASKYCGQMSREDVKISAQFSGIIPSEVRAQIKMESTRFTRVVLLQEVVAWDARPHPVPDPLVIGEKNGVYYLIACFDTTTLEEYVAKEFTAS